MESCNLKDIVVVPTGELGLTHLKETSIVSIGFSAKHIYKCAKDFSVEIKNLDIDEISEKSTIYGRRDEEWLLMELGPKISIYFSTEAFDKEVNLVEMWTNPLTDEEYKDSLNLKNVFYKKSFK